MLRNASALPLTLAGAVLGAAVAAGTVVTLGFWLGAGIAVILVVAGWILRGGRAAIAESAGATPESVLSKLAFEWSPDPILICDDRHYLACNEAAVRFFRAASREQLLGRSPSDLSPERQADGTLSSEAAPRNIQEAMRNGHARFEWTHNTLDGAQRQVLINLVPVVHEGQKLLLIYFQDIEDQMRERILKRQVADKVIQMVDTFSASSGDLEGMAKAMSTMSSDGQRALSAAASSASLVSENAQSVASATGQLVSSISEISQRIAQAAHISHDASEQADRANTMVQGLSETSDKIGAVVHLINQIASQTNLLALNATIEAARAGEAGKGFAVVANEVKHLATQTAKATEEISSQIDLVQDQTKQTVDAIQSIGRVIGEVREISSSIAAAAEQQGMATKTIAQNVRIAADGTQSLAQDIETVVRSASGSGETADRVLGTASTLASQFVTLRRTITEFVGQQTK